jgi:hypothetical protein
MKTEHLLQSSVSLAPDQLNITYLQSIVETVKLPPAPMSMLCPICFAEDSKAACICLDGNFQLTTLGTQLEAREEVPTQELDDMRLFLEDRSPSNERVSNAVGEANHRTQTWKDV